jgi:hypothetical protein
MMIFLTISILRFLDGPDFAVPAHAIALPCGCDLVYEVENNYQPPTRLAGEAPGDCLRISWRILFRSIGTPFYQ